MHWIPVDELEQGGANAPITELDAFERSGEGTAARLRRVLADATPLDALLVDKGADTLLVSLHGAIDREKTVLPRFERLRMILEHDVSALFFGDPTLHQAEKIQLTWYTGGAAVDVHREIADATQRIAAELGVKRIIFSGSSGGGFASLQIAALVPGSIALAFNAQTDIAKYRVGVSTGVQRLYVQTIWPEVWSTVTGPIDGSGWSDRVDDRVSAVRRYSTPQSCTIYLIQNEEEPHYEEHFLPFVAAAAAGGNRIVTRINREGPVHNPPRAATFHSELNTLLAARPDTLS